MSIPTIKIHNAQTNEIIEREMTADELTEWELDKIATDAKAKAKADAEAKRQEILDKLGLSAEEAKLLLG